VAFDLSAGALDLSWATLGASAAAVGLAGATLGVSAAALGLLVVVFAVSAAAWDFSTLEAGLSAADPPLGLSAFFGFSVELVFGLSLVFKATGSYHGFERKTRI
ncbi:MAG TPA: hypothetical protein PK156_47455, partial [Polyangium sp.]|nr:hypothetical protein [Polyangium sp.]